MLMSGTGVKSVTVPLPPRMTQLGERNQRRLSMILNNSKEFIRRMDHAECDMLLANMAKWSAGTEQLEPLTSQILYDGPSCP